MKNLKDLGLSNYCIADSGDIFSLRVNRFLKGWLDGNGYRKTGLTDDKGQVVQVSNHIINCSLNYPKPDKHYIVNHKDGVKSNAHKDNLEWVTPSENNLHAYETGLTVGKLPHVKGIPTLSGDYKESSGLTEELVHEVCQLISQGYRDVDISRMLLVGRSNISKIRHKHLDYWFWITKDYTFKFEKEERMSPEIVVKICELLESGMKISEVVNITGLNRKKVGNIKNRRTFTDISDSYKW